MLAVLGLFGLMAALALLAISANTVNVKHSGDAKDDADLTMLTNAALAQAMAEINTQTDHDGDGHLGCVGVAGTATGYTNPARLTVPNTNPVAVVGEFKTYVVNKATTPATDPPNYVIRALVAIPSFAAAEAAVSVNNRPRVRVAEAQVSSNVAFLLKPKAGAVSLAGPLQGDPDLILSNAAMSIDGRDPGPNGIRGDGDDILYPAIMFTDQSSMDNFTQDDQVDMAYTGATNPATGGLGTRIFGGPMQTFDRKSGNNNTGAAGTPAQYSAPFLLETGAAFSAGMLNDYKNALRNYAHSLAHATVVNPGNATTETVSIDYAAAAADTSLPGGGAIILHQHASVKDGAGVGKPRIVSNLNFGTAGVSTATVILDTTKFEGGMQNIADNFGDAANGRTISGNGTLIIFHPIGSAGDNNNTSKIPNLNWTGNVFIIGYPKDTNSTNGPNPSTDNLLYIDKADWTVNGNLMLLTNGSMEPSIEASSNNSANKATLTVNGAMLVFGEITTAEVDIEMESNATLTVNGMLGAYGSRLEIEAQSSSTQIQVEGTFAMGLPAGNTRNDDLSLRLNSNSDIKYSNAMVQGAVDGLTALQGNLQLSSSNLSSLDFAFDGMILRSNPGKPTGAATAGEIANPPAGSWLAYRNELAALVAASTARGLDPNLVVNNQ